MSDSNREVGSVESLLEKGAQILMEIRGYQRLQNRRAEGVTDIIVLDSRSEEKALIRVITKTKLKSGVSLDQIRELVKAVEEGDFHKGILIGQKISTSAKREARMKGIEFFTEKNLPTFNIFTHMLVPKHEILSKKEALKLLRKYRLKPYELPHIKASDPVIRLLGGKAGDIVKITRKSPTAGRAGFYRYVALEV